MTRRSRNLPGLGRIRRLATAALTLGVATVVASAPAMTTLASDNPRPGRETAAEQQRRDDVDHAIERGVAFLLSQQRGDGRFTVDDRNSTALTSLAIMTLLSVGHQPTDPTPEGRSIRNALAFVLRDDRVVHDGQYAGYLGQRDGSRMYGHGITTLMLSELLGMSADPKQDELIRSRLKGAVDLILRAQSTPFKQGPFVGGWRYTPDSRDADLSVTVWQVVALRSALHAGIDVPAEAIDEAVAFLERSAREDGQFGYQPGRTFGYSTTAAGLLAMQVCGQYDAPEVAAAADWLLEQQVGPQHHWFFYGTYYYAQGMYQQGGEHARVGRNRVEDALLRLQEENGSWIGHGAEAERIYATSFALLSLSVRYHYLPIYQR